MLRVAMVLALLSGFAHAEPIAMPSMKSELRLESLRWTSQSLGLLLASRLMSDAENEDVRLAGRLTLGVSILSGGAAMSTLVASFLPDPGDTDAGRDRAHALGVGGYIVGGLGAGTVLAGFALSNRYEDHVVWPIVGAGIGVVGAGVQAIVLGRRVRAASAGVVVSPTSNGIAIAGAF
jgi:hypothetical protein